MGVGLKKHIFDCWLITPNKVHTIYLLCILENFFVWGVRVEVGRGSWVKIKIGRVIPKELVLRVKIV